MRVQPGKEGTGRSSSRGRKGWTSMEVGMEMLVAKMAEKVGWAGGGHLELVAME